MADRGRERSWGHQGGEELRTDGRIPRVASGAGITVSGPLGSSPWGLQEDGHILFSGVSQAKEGSPGCSPLRRSLSALTEGPAFWTPVRTSLSEDQGSCHGVSGGSSASRPCPRKPKPSASKTASWEAGPSPKHPPP